MILEKNFNIMCSEVLEILKYCPEDDINKIPTEMINTLNENKDINHKTNIDPNKSVFDQPVSEETLVMILIILRNYWATEEEKKEIDQLLNENQLKLNDFYSYDNMFSQKTIKKTYSSTSAEVIEFKESFINKIINVIKKYFNK